MMYKLIFAPAFAADLQETFAYIETTLAVPQASRTLMQEIDRAISLLKEQPFLYPFCPEPLNALQYRKIVVRQYILIYYVDEAAQTVNLLRCFHGNQNYLHYFR